MTTPSLDFPKRIQGSDVRSYLEKFVGYDKDDSYYAHNGYSDPDITKPTGPLDAKPEGFWDMRDKKYNGHVYFKDFPLVEDTWQGRLKASCWPMSEQEIKVQEKLKADREEAKAKGLKGWTIGNADRPGNSKQAYDDFLRGLEVVGGMEYVKGGYNHIKELPDDQAGIILKEFKEDLPESVYKNPQQAKATLTELAKWERLIQLRRDAPIRRAWFKHMYDRVQRMHTSNARKYTPNGDPSKPFEGDVKAVVTGPSIRSKTLRLLVRPPEWDHDPFKAILLLYSTGTLLFAFATQQDQIRPLCRGAYMCPDPMSSGWRERPVTAPPAAFRQGSQIKRNSKSAWGLTLENTCTKSQFDAGTCDGAEVGYKIEWPYIETTSGTVQVPAELGCTVTLAGSVTPAGFKGYMYDPFQRRLLGEFWTCPRSTQPFTYMGVDFHFDSTWYTRANEATINCMKTIGDKYTVNQFNTDGDLQAKLETCFLNNDLSPSAAGGMCDCKADNALFYLSDTNIVNVNTHMMYGCMFASPDARVLIPRKYDACLSSEGKPRYYGIYSTDALVGKEKLDKSNDSSNGPSRRTALLVFLIIKEVGPIGGVIGYIALFILFAVLWIPLLTVVNLVCLLFPGQRAIHFKDSMWKLFEGLWALLTSIEWSLTCGMSSLTLAVTQATRVLGSKHLNAALVKDSSVKIAQIANVLFNVAVLMFVEGTIQDSYNLYISIFTSAVSIVLMIVLETGLLGWMNSFFKDLNENRLHKFEIALGLVKLMESFMTDDIECNFVEHFYGTARVRPLELDYYDKDPDQFDSAWDTWDAAAEQEVNQLGNGQMRDIFCCGDIQSTENPTIYPFYPCLPKDLADKFGHDNKYEYKDKVQETKSGQPIKLLEELRSDAKGKAAGKNSSKSPNATWVTAMPPVMGFGGGPLHMHFPSNGYAYGAPSYVATSYGMA